MGSSLHEKLIVSSVANERSLSEEIERILEDHFNEHAKLAERFGGEHNLTVLTAIASSWQLIEMLSKEKWTASSDVLHAIKAATNNVLDMVRATDEPLAPLGGRHVAVIEAERLAKAAAIHAVSLSKRVEIPQDAGEEIVEAAYEFRHRGE